MSRVDSESAFAAVVEQEFRLMFMAHFSAIAVTTLLIYDYFLTLSDEIRFVWRGKFSGATVLFLLNRYVRTLRPTLTFVLQYMYPKGDDAGTICLDFWPFWVVLEILWEILIAVFMALRMYAIWSGNRKIFVFVFLLCMVAPVKNGYYYIISTITRMPDPFPGCSYSVNLTNSVQSIGNIVCGVFNILADAIILVLTWVQTASIMRGFATLKIKTSLSIMLLRDETLYFLFLLALNIISLIAVPSQNQGNIPIISDLVTSVVISRFILNLRGVYLLDQDTSNGSFHTSRFSNIHFASTIVGNLGAPLDVEHDCNSPSSSPQEQGHREEDCKRKEEEIFSLDPMTVGLPNEFPSLSTPRLPMTATDASRMDMSSPVNIFVCCDSDEDEDEWCRMRAHDIV